MMKTNTGLPNIYNFEDLDSAKKFFNKKVKAELTICTFGPYKNSYFVEIIKKTEKINKRTGEVFKEKTMLELWPKLYKLIERK